MPEQPAVVQLIERQKAALLTGEQAHMTELARRWLTVERELTPTIELLAKEIAERKAAGQAVGISKLIQLDRYQSLLGQMRRELSKYSNLVEPLITGRQRSLALQGIVDAGAALRSLGVRGAFNILATEAVDTMIGLAGDGSPLRALLQATWPDAVQSVTNTMIRGATLGTNPRQLALQMQRATGASLNSMLRIARTEPLRTYRETSRQQYQASGAVQGFRRLAAKNARTCPACLMADGEEYDLGESLREHPQGRCTTVPTVIGFKPVKWQQGPDWFKAQPADVQRSVLGKGRFEAWQAGTFDLDQLVAVKQSDTWGASITPAPLSSLIRA